MNYPITIDGNGLFRVEVYWNLNKRCWSIRHCHGKLIADRPHRSAVALVDVLWNVQPGGQNRVRSEKRKNVHAVGRGWLLDDNCYDLMMTGAQLRGEETDQIVYCPYTMDGFETVNEPRSVYYSEKVNFNIVDGSPEVHGYRNVTGPKLIKVVAERYSTGTGELVHYELRTDGQLYVVGKDDDFNKTGFEMAVGHVMNADAIDTAIFNHEEEMMYLMQQAREEFGA